MSLERIVKTEKLSFLGRIAQGFTRMRLGYGLALGIMGAALSCSEESTAPETPPAQGCTTNNDCHAGRVCNYNTRRCDDPQGNGSQDAGNPPDSSGYDAGNPRDTRREDTGRMDQSISPDEAGGYVCSGSYSLEPSETHIVTSLESEGYGINVYLRDRDCNIISDQRRISYEWSVEDEDIAILNVWGPAIWGDGCISVVNPPCPNLHAEIHPLARGSTTIHAAAYRGSDFLVDTTFSLEVR